MPPLDWKGDALNNRTMPFETDTIDRSRAEAYHAPKAGRCVGGRVIFQGFPCPHCDSPNPLSRCKSPKGDALDKWEMPKNG